MAKFLTLAVAFSFLLTCLSLPTDIYRDIDDIDNEIDDGPTIDISHIGVDIYGEPNNNTGEKVSSWTEESLVNPEELGEYAEGDLLVPRAPSYGATRNGVNDQALRWIDGIVPYVVDGNYNQEQRNTIKKAIADYHRLTCLRFVPYSGQRDYIVIQSRNTGCWSSVGRIGGRQEVNLQSPGCVSKKGTVLHELLHAVGFLHEQSRPERDDYVKIRYDNVKYGSENNFKKADPTLTEDYGVSYDYNSVMHYSEFAFSKNGQRTIEPKVSNVKVGQREGLSRGDVRKVNNMYKCNKPEPQQGWLGAIWSGFFGN